MVRVLTLVAFLLTAAAPALADADRGADSFDANCAECHSVSKALRNKKGPTLFGVVGRRSASMSGFEYSDAMRAAGFDWTRDRLDAYVASPKKAVPGGKMKFDGVDDAGERADLIDFLEKQHAP